MKQSLVYLALAKFNAWCCVMVNHGPPKMKSISPCIWVEWQLTQTSCIDETPQVLLRWSVKTGWQLMTTTTKSGVWWRPRWCTWQSGRIYRYIYIHIRLRTIENHVFQIHSEVFPFLIHGWFFLVSSWWIIMYHGHPWPWTIMDLQSTIVCCWEWALGGLGLFDYA